MIWGFGLGVWFGGSVQPFEARKAFVERAPGNYYFKSTSSLDFRFLHKIKVIRYDYSFQTKKEIENPTCIARDMDYFLKLEKSNVNCAYLGQPLVPTFIFNLY